MVCAALLGRPLEDVDHTLTPGRGPLCLGLPHARSLGRGGGWQTVRARIAPMGRTRRTRRRRYPLAHRQLYRSFVPLRLDVVSSCPLCALPRSRKAGGRSRSCFRVRVHSPIIEARPSPPATPGLFRNNTCFCFTCAPPSDHGNLGSGPTFQTRFRWPGGRGGGAVSIGHGCAVGEACAQTAPKCTGRPRGMRSSVSRGRRSRSQRGGR